MYASWLKRVIDLVGSLLLLFILAPVFVVMTLLLAGYYKGNPFFVQQRLGRNNRGFLLYKYKSMRDSCDANGVPLSDTARLTPVGVFLRKTSLDELPQLLNVLKGEMSFIGPRPLFMRYLPFYTEREATRHTVRPGITGLAQVSGRNGLRWDERLELDAQYVENLSARLDFHILCRTISKVLRREDVAVIPGIVFRPLDVERSSHGD